MTTYTAEQIIRIGGQEWQKDGRHRVYLNPDVWAPMVGLKVEHYKSGNISYAELHGVKVSNRKAGMLLAIKVYWESDRIHITTGAELASEIRAAIATAVANLDKRNDGDSTNATAAGQVTALRAAGRTAREIAEMVGVAVSTIYRWARGICQPRPANAAALAALA